MANADDVQNTHTHIVYKKRNKYFKATLPIYFDIKNRRKFRRLEVQDNLHKKIACLFYQLVLFTALQPRTVGAFLRHTDNLCPEVLNPHWWNPHQQFNFITTVDLNARVFLQNKKSRNYRDL